MKFSDLHSLVDEYRKVQVRNASHWAQVLRKLDLVNPTPNSVVRLSKVRTWKEYLLLLMIHHYIPNKESRFLVKLELEDMVGAFGLDKEVVARQLLRSEPEALSYIIDSSLFKNTRSLFGFIGRNIEWRKYQLYIQEQRKSKRPVRKRGYQDHGSRRPDHRWMESHDWSLTELHNQIEKEREIARDTSEIIEGGL